MPPTSPNMPVSMITERWQGYRIGYQQRPSQADLDAILTHVRQPVQQSSDPLRGRLETAAIDLPDLGRAILKRYARGGFIRHFTQQTHLRRGTPRAAAEFQTLAQLAASGLAVPQPLVWGESGLVFVQTWLVMAEIPRSRSLAEIARDDASRATSLLPQVATVVRALIERGIHHVDFHPGNVLIDDQNQVFPIDFDKATSGRTDAAQFATRYRRRWNRAIAKHGLPPALEFSDDSLSV